MYHKKKHLQRIFFLILLFGIGCAKFETTNIGSSVISNSSQLNIKDTVIEVSAQTFVSTDTSRYGFFTNSTGSNLFYAGIGKIKDDNFGTKTGSIYFSLERSDNITNPFNGITNPTLDSAVLCLSIKSVYGDTVNSFKFNAYQLSQIPQIYTSGYYMYSEKLTFNSTVLGTVSKSYQELVKAGSNQVCFKLSDDFGKSFLNADTSVWTSVDNFKNFFNGFAVVPDASNSKNSIFNINILDTGSNLSIYYTSTGTDTTHQRTKFQFFNNSGISNHIEWDTSGAGYTNYLSNASQNEDFTFIQTNYQTKVRVLADALSTLPSNTIVYKAELIVPTTAPTIDPNSTNLAPNVMFLLVDLGSNNLGVIPKDYATTRFYSDQMSYLGGQRIDTTNDQGASISMYKFNISRYVQSIISKQKSLYPFIISSNNYSPTTDNPFVYNQVMNGQAKFEGGSKGKANGNQKIHIRIFYSTANF